MHALALVSMLSSTSLKFCLDQGGATAHFGRHVAPPLSGREGLDPRVHACWMPYLGWRWWRCPLLDLLCNSRTCRVKTHAPRLIHLMRTQKCCRCASVDCRVSLIHYNKLKFGYKILRCPCVYKTICHIEKIRKQPHIFLASEFGQ